MNDKIPLIYILSNGRSGTTLLDLLLGAHPCIWTLGEAQILPWELRNPRVPCGCGNPIPESEFWSELLDDIPTSTTGYHIGYFRNEQQVGKVLRWELLPDIARGRVSSRWVDAVDEYGAKNAAYFRVVHEAAEARRGDKVQWLVDASKDPYRLFWLQQSGRFDIRVIHLIKDPRALVYSMARDWLPYGANKVIRFTLRWIIENALMARLTRTSFVPSHVRRLKYEKLASRPEEALADLGEWIGVDYPSKLVHDFREYENFAISGNMMRWRETDDEIRLDERWKSDFPLPYVEFVNIVTRPFRAYCGYV